MREKRIGDDVEEFKVPMKARFLDIHSDYQKLLCPIWTPEMGVRLQIARRRFYMDQRELGALLGISQQTVSSIEKGKLKYAETNLFALSTALGGEMIKFIFFNAGAGAFDRGRIHINYWAARNKKRGAKIQATI